MSLSTLIPHSIPSFPRVSLDSRGGSGAPEGDPKARSGGLNNADKPGDLYGVIPDPPVKTYP